MMMSSPFLFGHQTGANYDWDNIASLQDNAKMDTQFQIGDNSRGVSEAVAKIGDVTYATLQSAIDAATEGQTVTIINDIVIETDHSNSAYGYFKVNEDDKITIDLNGKKITATENSNGNFLLFSNYGELTLNDSQGSAVVELTATKDRDWNAQSTIVLNRGGVLTINGGKYVHKGGTDMAITICNSANSFGPAYLYVKGGEIISETYIGVRMRMENPAANGNPGNDISYMYVYGGYIYGQSRGVWGQKCTGANEKQGELVVTGGTIENSDANRGAIQFDTDTYEAQNVEATISGAFIKGKIIAGTDEMSITGGTFTENVSDFCAEGYELVETGDGTYGVVEEGSVAQIVGGQGYPTLAGAFGAVENGETIIMLANVEVDEPLNNTKNITLDLNGKTISKTFAESKADDLIVNKGSLVITDNTETKDGKLTYKYTGNPDSNYTYDNATIQNEGTLTILAGIVENTTQKMSHASYAINTNAGATLNIEGGKVLNLNGHAIRMVSFGTAQNTVNVSGGYIEGTRALQVQLPGSAGSPSKPAMDINISGGELKSNESTYNLAIYVYSNGQSAENLIDLEISGDAVINGNVALNAAATNTMQANTAIVSGGTINGVYGIFSYADDNDHTQSVIEITGGTFATDYSAWYAEDDGYIFVETGDGTYSVVEDPNVAQIGETKYTSLQAAENAAKDGETIVLLKDIVLDGMVTFFNSANPRMLTLDMNNKTITMSDDWDNTTAKSAFWVCDGLTITGNGTINAAPANEAAVYAIIVGHRTAGTTDGNAGTLVIENGTFYGNDASVISVTNGIATINGGTFESPGEFDLNCIDDMYSAGKANITVKGGTFVGFNPENNAVEGAGTNFCAEGYAALPDLNGNFIVGVRPTATVNNLGRMTILAGDYSIWNGSFDPNTEDDGDMPLSFVMQFLADQDAEDMATSPFANWYGDFVITFTGIENESFIADGCYLAGHYGDFGWVKVPVDGMTIEDGVRYPVMLGVGMGQNYNTICSSVQDFMCALYLTPEILAANPNIQVNLALAIVDNSQGEDAATNALVKNENVYEVADYDYDAIDFNMNYVARIGDNGYETLQEAINNVQNNQVIELLTHNSENIVAGNENQKPFNKIFTIDGGNFNVTGKWTFGRDDHNTDNSEITVKNVNFSVNGITISDFKSVTINECTFKNITEGNGIYVAADEFTSSIIVENCEIEDVAGAGINLRNPVNATIIGNSIKNTGNNAITFQHGTAYTEAENGTYIITNNVLENWAYNATEGRAIRIATGVEPRAMTIENNAMIHDNAPEEFVKITGNTENVSIDKNYWNGANPVEEHTPAYYLVEGITPNSYYAVYTEENGLENLLPTQASVAQIDDYYYSTLEAAINAANAGETVKLIKNAEGSGVVINKSLTIDFNGKEYTFVEPAVGSNGTKTQGFQILKDNTVVLKNGILNVAEAAGEAFAMLIQNYANLTITDMTLDGNHLDRNNYSYVLSVNCGNVLINGSTSILANEVEGENHFAFDSYDYSAGGYTELPVVTVNTTGAIKGAVEVSATLNINALGEGSKISYISIDGKGQLFHNGLTTTIKKHIKGTEAEGWYTISSPVGTVYHTDVVGLLNGTHDLYYYNEEEMMWENVKDTDDNAYTTLQKGQGYLYANSVNTDLLFKGPLNTAAVTYSISYTEGNSLAGFNLIGNPFTYNITKSNMSGASLAEGFYTLSNQGAWQTNAESATIAPMQGALIKATEKIIDNFTIAPNSAKRSGSENNGQIKIEVSNDNYNDVAYVSFNKGIGLDKIEHRNANIPMVYVPVNGTNYAVAIMSQDVTEIPVSFVAKTMGEYTISVEAQDCEFAQMYLIDKMTGYSTNLLLEDYTFIATSKDNADRFIIRLVNSFDQSFGAENFVIFSNDEMMINDIQGEGVIRIVDVLGRPVAEYNVFGSANISTTSFRSGAYMIQVIDESGVKVQKIIID